MKNEIQHLTGSPECLRLTTLLLQNSNLENISSEFFKSMPKLVVLDLSRNRNLSSLPDGVSELVSLQYLNLSYTCLRHLPKGLQKLKNVIHLDLEGTPRLTSIEGISKLYNLKVLNLSFSGFPWDLGTVEELETLEHLEILTTGFDDLPPSLEKFLSSHRLTSCTQTLTISNSNLESCGIALPVSMDKLRSFSIWDCTISEIKTVSPLHNPRNTCFSSLSNVLLEDCKYLRELTFLMLAPNVKNVSLVNIDELEDIINKGKSSDNEESGIVPFSKLTSLRLAGLPELKSIYWSPLPFPCLESIDVIKCPNLKSLPLDSKSGKQGENGLIIKYNEQEWIESVEWEDEATKTRFFSSCKEPEGDELRMR